MIGGEYKVLATCLVFLQEEDEGYPGPPSPTGSGTIGSELATGVGTVEEGEQDNIDQLSDHNVSDTGWDTDLDIEGNKQLGCLKSARYFSNEERVVYSGYSAGRQMGE